MKYSARVKNSTPVVAKYAAEICVVLVAALIRLIRYMEKPCIPATECSVVLLRLYMQIRIDHNAVIENNLMLTIENLLFRDWTKQVVDPGAFRKVIPLPK